MSDVIPDQRNRVAVALGYLFHPYGVSVVTLAIVLSDLGWREAAVWVLALSTLLITPGVILIQVGRRQGRYVYQRASRTPLYITFGASLLACIGLIVWQEGPRYLLACFVALWVWLPLQLAINHYYTKISVHAAVIMACSWGVVWLGHVPSGPARLGLLLVVLATGWARYTTRNHSLLQILLGYVVGLGSVTLAFVLVL